MSMLTPVCKKLFSFDHLILIYLLSLMFRTKINTNYWDIVFALGAPTPWDMLIPSIVKSLESIAIPP